jgi:hypothetical protein
MNKDFVVRIEFILMDAWAKSECFGWPVHQTHQQEFLLRKNSCRQLIRDLDRIDSLSAHAQSVL